MKHRKGHLYKRGHRGEYIPAGDQRPGTYWLKYMLDGRMVPTSLGTRNRVEADKLREEIMGPIKKLVGRDAKQTLIRALTVSLELLKDDTQTKVPLDRVWGIFVPSQRRRPCGKSQLKSYEQQWQRFMDWAQTNKVTTMNQITNKVAEDYAKDLDADKKLASRTINKHLLHLGKLWRVVMLPASVSAKDLDEKEFKTPWKDLQSKRSDPQKPYRALTTDEITRAYDALDGEWRLLWLIGYSTAFSMIDAAPLRWENIDLERRVIKLPKGRSKTSHRTAESRVQWMPITQQLYDMLASTPAEWQREYVMPQLAARYKRDGSSISKHVKRALAGVGIADTEQGRASFHSLRATMQSACDDAEIPRAKSSKILVHATTAMSDRYSQANVKSMQAVLDQVVQPLGA